MSFAPPIRRRHLLSGQRWRMRLVFWGGAVDSQHILDRATPTEVAADARRHIAELAPGGGFVYASIHNIQPNVPPANVVALWTAIEEAGWYGDEPHQR